MDAIQFCGSNYDSWFYIGPPPPSASDHQIIDLDSNESIYVGDRHRENHNDEVWNERLEWRKWNLRWLEILQEFSRHYQPIHGNLCAVICAFGLLTNILNFIVLTRPSMRTSINMVLAAVALCDAGTMCSYLIYVVHFYVANQGACMLEIYTYNWMVFILFHSLWSILLHSSSIWLAVLLAFMRLSVMRKAKVSHSSLRAGHVWKPMTYIYAPLAALCIPVIFTHSVEEIPVEPCVRADVVDISIFNVTSEDHMTVFEVPPASGFTVMPSVAAKANNCLLLRAVLLINGLCFKLLPCLLLVFSIWCLLRTLADAKKRNSRILRSRRETSRISSGASRYYSSRTTKMLLIILLIFLITELPQAFIATLSGFYPNDVYFKVYPMLGDLLDLLSLLNSGVNFVLYCGMSSRFRATFVDLFAPRALRRRFQCPRTRRFSVSDMECPTTTGNGHSVNGLRASGTGMGSHLTVNFNRSFRAMSSLNNVSKCYSSFDVSAMGMSSHVYCGPASTKGNNIPIAMDEHSRTDQIQCDSQEVFGVTVDV